MTRSFFDQFRDRVVLVRQRDLAYVQRDEAIRERDLAFVQRDEAVRQRDVAMLQRDDAMRRRDALILERSRILAQPGKLDDGPGGRSEEPPQTASGDLAGCSTDAILPFLRSRLDGRLVMHGFPGVGNVVMADVAGRLLTSANRRFPIEPSDAGSAFTARYNRVHSLLTSAVPKHWQAPSYFQHADRGRAFFFVGTTKAPYLMIKDIELSMYFNAIVHSTHELADSETFAFYEALGYTVVSAVRHPLDTLAAFALKGFAHDDEILQTPARRASLEPKAFLARATLQDPRWLMGTARLLMDYYQAAAERAARHPPFRYEDAMSNPLDFARRVARCLDIDADEDTVSHAASVIGTKVYRSNHYNAPGLSKWRNIFTPAEVEMVAGTGLFEFFRTFGYDVPPPSEAFGAPVDAGEARERIADYACFHGHLAGTFDDDVLCRTYGFDIERGWIGSHRTVASHPGMIEEFGDRIKALRSGTGARSE